MLDVPGKQQIVGLAHGHAGGTDTESLRGHFFQLDLLWVEGDWADSGIVGGALHFGPDRIALDPEHARQLADKVRAAIDTAVSGSIIHRPTRCQGGH